MDCDSCGMLLFLKNNHRFWEDAKILDEIMREEKLAAAADTGIIDIEAAADEDGVILRVCKSRRTNSSLLMCVL